MEGRKAGKRDGAADFFDFDAIFDAGRIRTRSLRGGAPYLVSLCFGLFYFVSLCFGVFCFVWNTVQQGRRCDNRCWKIIVPDPFPFTLSTLLHDFL